MRRGNSAFEFGMASKPNLIHPTSWLLDRGRVNKPGPCNKLKGILPKFPLSLLFIRYI